MLNLKSCGFRFSDFGNRVFWTVLFGGMSVLPSVSWSVTPSPTPSPSAVPKKWVTAYYTGYNSKLLPISQIDFKAMTHIVVFTIGPNADGSIKTTFSVAATNAVGAAWAKSIAQAAHAHGVKALVTVGGGGICTWPTAGTSALATLVNNLIKFVQANDFDGIDLDEECGKSSILPTLVTDLKAAKPNLILTAAAERVNLNAPDVDANILEIAPKLDQLNIMTYGMSNNWTHWVSWHSSPLTGEGSNHPVDVQGILQAFVDKGVPPSKLGVGIGFFGICWGAPIVKPLQALTATDKVKAGDGTLSITNIDNLYKPVMVRNWDHSASVPYLVSTINAGPAGCTFLSYEDRSSISLKGDFILSKGYGGAIVWNLPEGYNPQDTIPNRMIETVYNSVMK